MDANALIGLGLTDGEAKVYLALLTLGPSTVGPVVKKSKIAYSNIYEVLNRLINKGLVSFVTKEKTKYFSAAEPYRFNEYLESKEKKLNEEKQCLAKLIPQLVSIKDMKKEKLEAEIFLGTKAMKTIFTTLLKEEKGDYLFFYSEKEKKHEVVDDFFAKLLPMFSKSKLNIRGVADKSYKNSEFLKKAEGIKVKFVTFPIVGNMDIFNDKVLITTWGETPMTFLIHSKELANSMKNYFNYVWRS